MGERQRGEMKRKRKMKKNREGSGEKDPTTPTDDIQITPSPLGRP
jgi:hypothetical protein